MNYSEAPVREELMLEQSVLPDDGINKPVVGVRLTDRKGNPERASSVGVRGETPVVAGEEMAQEPATDSSARKKQ